MFVADLMFAADTLIRYGNFYILVGSLYYVMLVEGKVGHSNWSATITNPCVPLPPDTKKLPVCRRRRQCSWLVMTLLFADVFLYLRYSFTFYTYLGKMSPMGLFPVTCTADLLSKPRLVSEQKRTRNVKHITCQQILFGSGNETVYEVAREIMAAHPVTYIDDEQFVKLTSNCFDFRRRRGYHLSPLDQEEAQFSIAYNIIMHKHIEQVRTLSKQKTS